MIDSQKAVPVHLGFPGLIFADFISSKPFIFESALTATWKAAPYKVAKYLTFF